MIWIERRRLIERRLYFLLAANGACMGFTITQLSSLEQSSPAIFIMSGLGLFALSFIVALWQLSVEDRLLKANDVLLEMLATKHAAYHETIKEVASGTFRTESVKVSFLGICTIILLFSGALLVAIGKILECAGCRNALNI